MKGTTKQTKPLLFFFFLQSRRSKVTEIWGKDPRTRALTTHSHSTHTLPTHSFLVSIPHMFLVSHSMFEQKRKKN